MAPPRKPAGGDDSAGHLAALVWVAFAVAVPALAAIDHACLAERHRQEVSISTAFRQCAFWIVTGLGFNAFVWCALGTDEAISWLSGYVLEYMLSIDNLFCFHLIFTSYRTPKDQTHRALFYGIGGAMLLRLILFALGASMFNFTVIVHWIFGTILLWSGYKVMLIDDDDADTDHRQNWLVRLTTKVFPVVDCYGPQAAFFVSPSTIAPLIADDGSADAGVRGTDAGGALELDGLCADEAAASGGWLRRGALGSADDDLMADAIVRPSETSVRDLEAAGGFGGASSSQASVGPASQVAGGASTSANGADATNGNIRRDHALFGNRKATLLFLVVITLGAVDLVFAFDSITAKVSMVSQFDDRIDLALNFTSSAFTMLTLRSLYFLLASMVHIFRLMKYGVGVILIMIGLRLILSSWVPFSEALFCAVMIAVFLVSMVASLLLPVRQQDGQRAPGASIGNASFPAASAGAGASGAAGAGVGAP